MTKPHSLFNFATLVVWATLSTLQVLHLVTANTSIDAPVRVVPIPPDWPDSRGWKWVRANPTFVSALTVKMGPPPNKEAVERYLKEFGATAAHLWQEGVPTAIQGWLQQDRDVSWVAWLDRDGSSRENHQLPPPNIPGRIGFQISDEPWSLPLLNETLQGFDNVRQVQPDAILIFNFLSGAPRLDEMFPIACANGNVDIYCYDRYDYSDDHYEIVGKIRDAALKCGIPYWRYLQAIPYKGFGPSTSRLRWDALMGVVYGYTGHTWFTYNFKKYGILPSIFLQQPDQWNSTTTKWFGLAATLNRQLVVYGQAQRRLRSTAVAYFIGTNKSTNTATPKGIQRWIPGTGLDPVLKSIQSDTDAVLGYYQDALGDVYVVLQNVHRAEDPTNTTAVYRLELDFSQQPHLSSHQVIQLTPRGVLQSLPLQDGSSLTLTIDGGDIVFFKYDTGNPFAGYEEQKLPSIAVDTEMMIS